MTLQQAKILDIVSCSTCSITRVLLNITQNDPKVIDAGKALKDFVDKYGTLSEKDGMKRPLIILSFDEAHELTEFKNGQDWSVYVELRRVLASIVALPIFSLFLS